MVSDTRYHSVTELDLVAERLETRGLRVTPARRAVLAAVLAAGPHFTVDEVCQRARGVGRATAFRTMRLLQHLNVVCRVLLDDGRLHYRLNRTRGHHHHLVCTGCGRVEAFTNCGVPALAEEVARRTDYEIEGHWLEVYGRCRACRSRPSAGRAGPRGARAGRTKGRGSLAGSQATGKT
jgi:Fur family ferric uptake transcriptional regulator